MCLLFLGKYSQHSQYPEVLVEAKTSLIAHAQTPCTEPSPDARCLASAPSWNLGVSLYGPINPRVLQNQNLWMTLSLPAQTVFHSP